MRKLTLCLSGDILHNRSVAKGFSIKRGYVDVFLMALPALTLLLLVPTAASAQVSTAYAQFKFNDSAVNTTVLDESVAKT